MVRCYSWLAKKKSIVLSQIIHESSTHAHIKGVVAAVVPTSCSEDCSHYCAMQNTKPNSNHPHKNPTTAQIPRNFHTKPNNHSHCTTKPNNHPKKHSTTHAKGQCHHSRPNNLPQNPSITAKSICKLTPTTTSPPQSPQSHCWNPVALHDAESYFLHC